MMTYEDLAQRDVAGNTAFCLAAASGNVKLAQLMMKDDNYDENANLAMTRGRNNELPFYMAASRGRRKMARYLYDLTKALLEHDYYDKKEIFVTLIHADIYDVALTMIMEDGRLAIAQNRRHETALHVLAQKSCLGADISLPKHQKIWNKCTHFFSFCKIFREKSDMHEEATALVETIWTEIVSKHYNGIASLIGEPWRLIFVAAEKGNADLLRILIYRYPSLLTEVDVSGYTIFDTAVKHRQERVFKLMHEFSLIKNLKEKELKIMLNLAAKLPCTTTRLHVVPGAALQLQRELLWFEEVKKVVQGLLPLEETIENDQTPEALFIESHKNLIKPGEIWMRGTADKCMVVATLIATVAFAAAFTVPGGNGQDDGVPVLLRNIAFRIFAASDAVSLISSVASVFSFLGIMTSRYQLYDFYWSLPHKLMIGLATLFISIVAMLISFGSTLFLVWDLRDRLMWFAIPIAVVTFAPPVIVFVLMHWSLLMDIIKQTYRSKSIFRPKKKSIYPLFQVTESYYYLEL